LIDQSVTSGNPPIGTKFLRFDVYCIYLYLPFSTYFSSQFAFRTKMPINIVEKTYNDVYPAIDPKGKLSGAAAGKVVLLTGASKGIGEVPSLNLRTLI
jgi:hypothetical protein